jgi:predicted AlkP superfamily pyrophosphatase or phosphodiesterase
MPRAIRLLVIASVILASCALSHPPSNAETSAQSSPAHFTPAKNLLLIGWDGVQWNHVNDLINAGKLPNLAKLKNAGAFAHTMVTDHETCTKPGWAQINSGLPAKVSGIYSNSKFRPMPSGATICEKLEALTGHEVFTCFIAGKSHHLGSLGPNVNIPFRKKTQSTGEGEPWYYSRAGYDEWFGDTHRTADEVGGLLLETLREYAPHNSFAIFAHFGDPDSAGHKSGENSSEYEKAIEDCDVWLGTILARLEKLKVLDNTLVVVVTDHGFDEGMKQHSDAPDTFFAANDAAHKYHNGDMMDIAPTILTLLGVPETSFSDLPGKPLWQ